MQNLQYSTGNPNHYKLLKEVGFNEDMLRADLSSFGLGNLHGPYTLEDDPKSGSMFLKLPRVSKTIEVLNPLQRDKFMFLLDNKEFLNSLIHDDEVISENKVVRFSYGVENDKLKMKFFRPRTGIIRGREIIEFLYRQQLNTGNN